MTVSVMPPPKRPCGESRRERRLKTTVIGSYPKPCYCKDIAPDWFEKRAAGTYKGDAGEATAKANAALASISAEEREATLLKATDEILKAHEACGVDVPTDGEVRRENYIHHLCRSIEGISFEDLTREKCRPRTDAETGETIYAFEADLPTVVGPVKWRKNGDGDVASSHHPPSVVVAEWKAAQALLPDRDVKYTLPGPMTIIGTVANRFYTSKESGSARSEEALARDLSVLVKECVDALVAAGCKEIQIDEPLFARRTIEAIAWGIPILGEVVADVPRGAGVFTTCHICCGYPNYIDQTDYVKADKNAYIQLAPHLAKINIDGYSLEGAHRPIDFKRLKENLGPEKTLVLGCVKIASSRLDTVEEIRAIIEAALCHFAPEKLIVAPDCGLAFLPKELADQKLENMVQASRTAQAAGAGA